VDEEAKVDIKEIVVIDLEDRDRVEDLLLQDLRVLDQLDLQDHQQIDKREYSLKIA
jgi:hypothetical protein